MGLEGEIALTTIARDVSEPSPEFSIAYRTLESDFGCRGSPRKYDAHLPVLGTLGDPGVNAD
jgi:hypothetical protein